MNLEIIRSEYFTAAFKKLSKRYRGIVDDYESFLEDLKADALVSEQGGKLYLLFIYDKAEASNVKMNVIKAIIKELGL